MMLLSGLLIRVVPWLFVWSADCTATKPNYDNLMTSLDATNLLTFCNNLLQQVVATACDNRSVASCQQTCCKLIFSTGLLQLVSPVI